MSATLSDFAKISIRCPRCSRTSQFKVGRVRHNPKVKCPTCLAPFVVDTAKLTHVSGGERL
jgi:transposase-like protein